MKALPASSLFGVFFGFLQFASVNHWFINRVNGSGPTALFYPKQDSYLYLIQLNHYLQGGKFTSNPLSEESELFGVGNSLIYPIFGYVGNLFGFSLEVLFVLIVLLTSITTYYLIKRIIGQLIGVNDWRSPLTSFFICITFIGDEFLRPSPTQWVLPFAMALVLQFLRNRQDSFARLLIILSFSVLVIALNPYYSLFMIICCLIPLVGLLRYKKLSWSLLTVVAFVAGDFISNKVRLSDRSDSIDRWGFLFTHLPGSMELTVLLLICIFLNQGLKRHFNEKPFDFRTWDYVFLALLFSLQQNVITGIWWEPESHLKTISYLLIGIYLLSLLHLTGPKKVVVLGLIALSVLNLVTFSKTLPPRETMNEKAKSASVQVSYLKTISQDLKRGDKNSIPLHWYQNDSYQIFLLLSNQSYFWVNEMPYFSFSNEFLFQRFACMNLILRESGFDEIDKIVLEVHGVSNKIQFYSKWNQFYSKLGLNSLVYNFGPIDEFRQQVRKAESELDLVKCRIEYQRYSKTILANSGI